MNIEHLYKELEALQAEDNALKNQIGTLTQKAARYDSELQKTKDASIKYDQSGGGPLTMLAKDLLLDREFENYNVNIYYHGPHWCRADYYG